MYSTESLMLEARRISGLDDFGRLDFLPAFMKLVDSFNDMSDLLHDKGRKGLHDRIVRLLINRLRIQRDLKAHPEILRESLLPPTVIVGLPRTGSTKLQRMLAAGGSFLEALMWQGFNPAPFPESTRNGRDPRIQAAIDYVASINEASPDALRSHSVVVEEVEEESMLLELTFDTLYPIAFGPIFRHLDFIERIDKTPMYEYLRTCLQYLQWQFHRGEAKPWLLKYPPNLGHESYISRALPGARYIVPHRDPVKILPSLTEISSYWLLYCKSRDKVAFSQWALREFSSEMERHLAWRQANPDARVLDLSFKEIASDGLGVARRVYEFLDIKLTPEAEKSIRTWLAANEQGERLPYSYEGLGITEDDCRSAFAEYYVRFGEYL